MVPTSSGKSLCVITLLLRFINWLFQNEEKLSRPGLWKIAPSLILRVENKTCSQNLFFNFFPILHKRVGPALKISLAVTVWFWILDISWSTMLGQKALVVRSLLSQENLNESQKFSISGTFSPPNFSGSLASSRLIFSILLFQMNLKNIQD